MDHARRINEQDPDSDLIAAVKAGDTGAFEELFRRNQRRVYSVALNFFGGSTQAAEDVTQQVFLKFYTNLKKFRGDARVSTWLYRITLNLCIDEQKRSRRFSFFGDLFEKDEGGYLDEPHELPGDLELEDEVRRAVAELKPVFRIPVVLRHVEGMSYSEMAEVMDCTEGTIASRLSRGHKLLAEKLKHLKDEK